jgi:hypothetical protein
MKCSLDKDEGHHPAHPHKKELAGKRTLPD